MKIVRIPFAVSLTMLAASAAIAVVPSPNKVPAGGADPDRAAWRGQAVAICVAEMHQPEGVTAEEIEATCGCGLDRFMDGKRTDDLPALGTALVRHELASPLMACATTQRMPVVLGISHSLATPSTDAGSTTTTTGADAKPDETGAPSSAAPRRTTGPDFDFSMPDWLSGSSIPAWAWVVLAFVGFMVLRGLRRGGDQADLIGPPRTMRPTTRLTPPPPRPPEPPQRG